MQTTTVLVADDHSTFRGLAAHFLEGQEGMAVVGAVKRDEALAGALRLHPEVVLIDLGTPGLEGLRALAQLRTTMPDVRIIAMSLLRAEGYRGKALAAGADGFVLKGSLESDLLPLLRRPAPSQRGTRQGRGKFSRHPREGVALGLE